MDVTTHGVDRRMFLSASAGLGLVALLPRESEAAPSAAEQANIKVVSEFCAAWPSHDLNKILGFFADNGAYRMTETMEPAKGKDAMAARIKTIIDAVVRFDVLETFARGPMVINERVDYFSSGPLKSWRGVGVFFLKDGKIVEWYDYTIAMDRA